MTTTEQSATGVDSNGDPATVGGIVRLNATDGLFLRAEHLAAMQDYARELAFATAMANGAGVVHGFTVTLAGDSLEVSPGLAVASSGHVLRSSKLAEVALSGLLTEPNRFWVVEIIPATWVFGSEKAYGNLCDDPCNGSAIAPWQVEGCTVRLREDAMSGLEGLTSIERRNWLASKYFERERKLGGPWLTPSQPGGPVGSLTARDWSAGIPRPEAAGVPIAVVQRVGDNWVLDAWTARRDMGDPPARRTWQWRLAMRPWDVFLAQVLQFQAQLAVTAPALGGDETVDPSELIANLDEFVQGMAVKPKQLRAVVDALKKVAPTVIAGAGGQSLLAQGFVELPPAGFLRPVISVEGGYETALAALFGGNVDVRVCHCRADHVPYAIEKAQHLDRIPLGPSDIHPQVDVLIPDKRADLPDLAVDEYGWIAFVRRSDAECEEEPVQPPPVDLVDVYLSETEFDPALLERLAEVEEPPGENLGQLTYPAGAWAYPESDIVERLPLEDQPKLTLVALARTDERRPLAALRASLFAASFDGGIPAPDIHAVTATDAEREAIVIFPPPPSNPDSVPPTPG